MATVDSEALENSRSIFDDIVCDGKRYKVLAVVCEHRAKATAELYKKYFHVEKDLVWIQPDARKVEGYICYEL